MARITHLRVPPGSFAAWFSLSLLLAGCGTSPASADGSAADAPRAAAALRLGEGEREFRAIADGDTLLLGAGCQGIQHVWMTLQSEGLDPRGVVVQLSLTRVDDVADPDSNRRALSNVGVALFVDLRRRCST